MGDGSYRSRNSWPALDEFTSFAVTPDRRGGFKPFIRRIIGSFPFCLLLLFLTVATTLVVGVHLQDNFSQHLPVFNLNLSWAFFAGIFHHPTELKAGVPYAGTLIAILLAHEMGHYLACKHYRVDATYPYFIPAPTLIGTFGAFILIRSPLVTREELFDVGIAGPIAGFVVTVPALIAGVWHGSWMRASLLPDSILLGHPWAVTLLHRLLHPALPLERFNLSPVGCAAYIGLFLTALNLLPIGQLDGGHIVCAVFGKKHRYVSWAAFLSLIPLGIFFWAGWIVWAIVTLPIIGLRHPPTLVEPDEPLDSRRKALAAVALGMFLLSLTLSPFAVL